MCTVRVTAIAVHWLHRPPAVLTPAIHPSARRVWAVAHIKVLPPDGAQTWSQRELQPSDRPFPHIMYEEYTGDVRTKLSDLQDEGQGPVPRAPGRRGRALEFKSRPREHL